VYDWRLVQRIIDGKTIEDPFIGLLYTYGGRKKAEREGESVGMMEMRPFIDMDKVWH